MKGWATEIAIGALILALVYWLGYMRGEAAVSGELENLRGQVAQQGREARERLNQLTAQRDAMQAKADRQAAEQEKKDADAKAEIDRLAGELERRPVRVRILAGAGNCGGGAAGEGAADSAGGAGDSRATHGVLPPENSRRLDAALIEVETLGRAYNQCRARLLPKETPR